MRATHDPDRAVGMPGADAGGGLPGLGDGVVCARTRYHEGRVITDRWPCGPSLGRGVGDERDDPFAGGGDGRADGDLLPGGARGDRAADAPAADADAVAGADAGADGDRHGGERGRADGVGRAGLRPPAGTFGCLGDWPEIGE